MVGSEFRLESLLGLPLWSVGAACDLLWVQFGSRNEIQDRRGRTRLVGDLALHVNAPWRFHRDGKILVGSCDLHYDAATGEWHDWGGQEATRFSVYARRLNEELDADHCLVEKVLPDGAKGFRLELSGRLFFDVMPNASLESLGIEFWRLFSPGADRERLVVGT